MKKIKKNISKFWIFFSPYTTFKGNNTKIKGMPKNKKNKKKYFKILDIFFSYTTFKGTNTKSKGKPKNNKK